MQVMRLSSFKRQYGIISEHMQAISDTAAQRFLHLGSTDGKYSLVWEVLARDC